MKTITRRIPACSLALLLATAGCGPGRRGNEAYVPSDDRARPALEAALEAWRRGDPPGDVPGQPVAVYLVDSHRKPGQKLVSYTVLGPAPGEFERCYMVRATFEQPTEEQRLRFYVAGIDPLWVIRHEDFIMITHWEHPMPATAPKKN